MNRRKGVPCGCDADPCGSSRNCVKRINNQPADPNGDYEIAAGSGIGIQNSEYGITIVNTATSESFTEGKNIDFTEIDGNIEISVVDDPVIDGTLTVNGDIVQNGSAYETHAEKVFTKDDYIVMRDGAVGGLAVGDYSGFQVEKYDGTNDGRLVIDHNGVARVGDVNDEQPLMTRDESADLTDGGLLAWDAANQKAITATSVHANTADNATRANFANSAESSNTAVSAGTASSATHAANATVAQFLGSTADNVGNDTKPVKIVNGKAVAVTRNLLQSPAYMAESSTSGGDYYPTIWTIYDTNGREVMNFKLHFYPSGKVGFYVRMRNADNTWTDVSLAN